MKKDLAICTLPDAYGLAGIFIKDATNVSLGVGSTQINQFRNLNLGVYVNNTPLNVENCRFSNIMRYDVYPKAGRFSGTAIGCAADFMSNPSLTVRGANNLTVPDFLNCHNGIVSRSYNQNIFNNVMLNCDLGVQSILGSLATISIENNIIHCNSVGVSLLSNDGAMSVKVYDNKIYAGENSTRVDGIGSSTIAIDIQNNSAGSFSELPPNYLIQDNIIELSEFSSKGIHLNNVSNYQVLRNNIQLDNINRTTMNGILMSNSRHNTLSCNAVIGNRGNQTFYFDLEAGIRVSTSRNNLISQNAMSYTSNGLVLHGECSDFSTNPSQSIQNNTFGRHFYGLHYTTTARMNPQFYSGNDWLVPGTNLALNAINENVQRIGPDKYIVSGSSSSLPASFTPAWFDPDNSQLDLFPYDCGNLPSTGSGGGIGLARLLEIALDSLQSTEYEQEMLWQAKVALYEYLLKFPEELTGSSDLADFYLSNSATAIHYIAALNIERDSILNNQRSVIEQIRNKSFEIYQKSMQLKECDSLLMVEGISEKDIDSLLFVCDQLMFALDYLTMSNAQTVDALKGSILNNVDLLNQVNGHIEGNEVYENNEVLVNDAYFNTIALGYLDSLVNYESVLINVAFQCPIAGGPAVFRARSLYKLLNPDFDMDDISACIQSGYTYRKSFGVLGNAKFYPNPTTGQFTLTFGINEDAKFEISDCLGRICVVYSLTSQESSINGSLDLLESGIYSFRIVGLSGNQIDAGRIVLNR